MALAVADVIVEPVRALWQHRPADAAAAGTATVTAEGTSKIPLTGMHTGGEPM